MIARLALAAVFVLFGTAPAAYATHRPGHHVPPGCELGNQDVVPEKNKHCEPAPEPEPFEPGVPSDCAEELVTKAESVLGAGPDAIGSDGEFWCADLIRWVAGADWADPFVDVRRLPESPGAVGDVVLLAHPGQPGAVGHVALVTGFEGDEVHVIEGNGASRAEITRNTYPLALVWGYRLLPCEAPVPSDPAPEAPEAPEPAPEVITPEPDPASVPPVTAEPEAPAESVEESHTSDPVPLTELPRTGAATTAWLAIVGALLTFSGIVTRRLA